MRLHSPTKSIFIDISLKNSDNVLEKVCLPLLFLLGNRFIHFVSNGVFALQRTSNRFLAITFFDCFLCKENENVLSLCNKQKNNKLFLKKAPATAPGTWLINFEQNLAELLLLYIL